jgi:hypothetical protein
MAIVKFFPGPDGTFAVEIDGQRVPDVVGFAFEVGLEQPAKATIEVRASAESSVESDVPVRTPMRAPLLNPTLR